MSAGCLSAAGGCGGGLLMVISRRNSALTYYVSGRRAHDLHGLDDLAGNVLSSFDLSVQRAQVGLRRRALPAASRNVREQYNVKAGAISGKFRVEQGVRGRDGDRSELISIWASTRRMPLLEFSGRWRGPARRTSGRWAPPATAEIVRGQRKVYESAFVATIRGRRALRVRQWASGTGRRHGRGPVRMLYGPSPFEMLSGVGTRASRAARDATLSELTTYYLAELRRQFRMNRST